MTEPHRARRPPCQTHRVRKILLLLAAVLTLAACGGEEGVPEAGEQPWNGGPLAAPLAFHVVLQESQGACPAGEQLVVEDTATGSCLRLAPAEFELRSVDGARVENRNGGWQLDLRLTKADAERFGVLTTRAATQPPPQNRIAMVLGGNHLVSAPMVQEAITGGDISIAGPYTEDEIRALLKRLRG